MKRKGVGTQQKFLYRTCWWKHLLKLTIDSFEFIFMPNISKIEKLFQLPRNHFPADLVKSHVGNTDWKLAKKRKGIWCRKFRVFGLLLNHFSSESDFYHIRNESRGKKRENQITRDITATECIDCFYPLLLFSNFPCQCWNIRRSLFRKWLFGREFF